jgi:hypothetical protein
MNRIKLIVALVFVLFAATITAQDLTPPTNLTYEVFDGNNVQLNWNPPQEPNSFNENFEAGIPESWTLIDNDGDGYNWHSFSTGGYMSEGSAFSSSMEEEALTPDNWMISPEIVPSSQSELSFWVKQPYETGEHFEVKISTNGPELENFETIYEETIENNEWHKVTIDLVYYSEICAYIAWQHTGVTGISGIQIDDVQVTNTAVKDRAKELTGYNVYRDGTLLTNTSMNTYFDENLEDGTYSYYVTATYDEGESAPTNTVEPQISSAVADVSFEDGIIPEDWITINADGSYERWKARTIDPHSGEYAASVLGYNQSDDWLITPRFKIEAGVEDSLSFWMRHLNDMEDAWEILVSTTTPDPDQFNEVLESGTYGIPNYVNKVYDLDEYDGQNIYIAFHYIANYGWQWTLDDFILPPIAQLDNDISMQNLSGEELILAEEEANFTVALKNTGSYPQMEYSVALYDQNNTELANVSGDFMIPGEEKIMQIPWTPQTTGNYTVHAKVLLANDENPYNDTTNDLPVSVQASGSNFATMGTCETYSENMPLNILWHNSLTETIYMADELAEAGVNAGPISAISYHYKYEVEVEDINFKVWIGETDQTSLEDGWIDAGNLEKKFVGSISFVEGDNHKLTINFTEPYQYSGGNLIVMAQRPYIEEIHAGMNFYYYNETLAYPFRSLVFYDDIIVADPYDPPTEFEMGLLAAFPRYPTTTFTMEEAGEMLPPANLSAEVQDNNDVLLTWDSPSPEATGYNLFRNGSQLNDEPITETQYMDASVEPGWYTYWATAIYPGGESDFSDIAEVQVTEALNPPVEMTVELTTDGALMSWNAPAKELVGYKIYLDGDYITTTEQLSYLFTELTAGQTYTAGLSATYTTGESEVLTEEFVWEVTGNSNNLPLKTQLTGNYPNPFNPDTTIKFSLKETSQVRLDIFNIKGQKVTTLVNSNLEKGQHQINWDGKDDNGKAVTSGIYYYKMTTKDFSNIKKMMLIK